MRELVLQIGLDSLDIRMLRLLHLLLVEKNVSRVATLLGQSQPTVSQALRKCREIFGDPLLVRNANQLTTTARGDALCAALETALAVLDNSAHPAESFEPGTATTRFRIAAVNSFGCFLIPTISAIVRGQAPGAGIDFLVAADHPYISRDLGDGKIDIVVGNWPDPSEGLQQSVLLASTPCCIMRSDHPFAGRRRLTLEEYLSVDHISPTSTSNCQYSPVDGQLHKLRKQRRIAVSMPEFSLIPLVVAETDLIFTTARPFGDHIIARDSAGSLTAIEAPPELGAINLHMLWHARTQTDPAMRWMRDVIRQAVKHMKFEQAEDAAEPAPVQQTIPVRGGRSSPKRTEASIQA